MAFNQAVLGIYNIEGVPIYSVLCCLFAAVCSLFTQSHTFSLNKMLVLSAKCINYIFVKKIISDI